MKIILFFIAILMNCIGQAFALPCNFDPYRGIFAVKETWRCHSQDVALDDSICVYQTDAGKNAETSFYIETKRTGRWYSQFWSTSVGKGDVHWDVVVRGGCHRGDCGTSASLIALFVPSNKELIFGYHQWDDDEPDLIESGSLSCDQIQNVQGQQ